LTIRPAAVIAAAVCLFGRASAADVAVSTAGVAVSTAGVAVSSASAAAAPTAPRLEAKPSRLLARARALYFASDALTAARAFESAVKASPTDVPAWRDGAIAWAEAGRPDKAVEWSRRAAALAPSLETSAALGWALLRAARPAQADAAFADALKRDPDYGWAVLGAGRAKLALGRTGEAVELLRKAEDSPMQQTLADFYLGRAEEKLGDGAASAEAYRRAVASDAYFHEGRNPLSRAYVRIKRYDDAWRQLQRLADAEPSTRLTRALIDRVRPLLTRSRAPAVRREPIAAPEEGADPGAKIPVIRVGIGTTALGRPRPRVSVTIRGAGPWRATEPKSRRLIAECGAQRAWTVLIVSARGAKGSKKKSGPRLELRGPDGEVRAVIGDTVLLAPDDSVRGVLSLEDDPDRGGPLGAGRALRGVIEVTLIKRLKSLRLVNIVDLEDYTEGVVGAEMPSRSPLEALKAQALVARTHALYIKKISFRHRKDGYDVCDGEHCQVYAGLRAETERTRAAVAATRARVIVYRGELAHAIYSANCGGSTQSGRDIGWGDVPYWQRVCDSAQPAPTPDSPTALRRFLSTWPNAFCRPSADVHPSHSRWARVISAKDLEEKLNRKSRFGSILGLRVLRRAPTGHVEALLVVGSKRSKKLTDESDIRGLLGLGSLRSTLFVVDTEYRLEAPPPAPARKGRKAPVSAPVLVPDAFVFRGGGWGHAVGMCQSGAIGRAEAGQDAEAIVKAYFAGVRMTNLRY
jgi:SpoIID/LytB domain protein